MDDEMARWRDGEMARWRDSVTEAVLTINATASEICVWIN